MASTTRWPSLAWAARGSPSIGTKASTTSSSTPVRIPSFSRRVQGGRRLLVGDRPDGMGGITLARPLQLRNKPVTRVEIAVPPDPRHCEAPYTPSRRVPTTWPWRSARKVKDSSFQGLNAVNPPGDRTARTLTAAAVFSMVAPAYGQKYGVDDDTMADVLASIAVKNHHSGARNRAQLAQRSPGDRVELPRLAGTLGVFDCAGVADGAATAIVVQARTPSSTRQADLHQGALLATGSGSGLIDPGYITTSPSARPPRPMPTLSRHHRPAGSSPWRRCTTASRRPSWSRWRISGSHPGASAWKEVLAGAFDLDGDLPIKPRRRVEVVRSTPSAPRVCACSSSAGSEYGRPRRTARSATTDHPGLAMTHNRQLR